MSPASRPVHGEERAHGAGLDDQPAGAKGTRAKSEEADTGSSKVLRPKQSDRAMNRFNRIIA
jgi:hypothetical protein